MGVEVFEPPEEKSETAFQARDQSAEGRFPDLKDNIKERNMSCVVGAKIVAFFSTVT